MTEAATPAPAGRRRPRRSGRAGALIGSLLGLLALLGLLPGAPGLPAAAQAVEDPFEVPPAVQALRLRGLTARPAALMLSGETGGPIPLGVLAVPFPSESEGKPVAVLVEMAIVSLTGEVPPRPEAAGPSSEPAPDGPSPGETGEATPGSPASPAAASPPPAPPLQPQRAEVYVYALDAQGAPRGVFTQTFKVPASYVAGRDGVLGVKLFAHLTLPPGAYDLRVLVIATPSGRFGLERRSFVVPDAGQPSLVSSPPLLPEPEPERWLLVREAPHDAGGAYAYPFHVAGEAFLPAARPVFGDGHETAVYLLQGAGAPGGLPVLGRLESDDGPLGDLKGGGFRTTGSAAVRWQWTHGPMTVQSPETGPARLVIQVGEEATAPLPVILSGSLGAMPWTAIVAGEEPEGRTASARPEGTAEAPRQDAEDKDRVKPRELNRAGRKYEEALQALAAGEPATARRLVRELEAGIIEGRSLGAIAALKAKELEILQEASASEPGVLLPPARLHLQLLEAYTREVRLLLSVQAREMVRALFDLFAQRSTSAEDRKLAADLHARFGAYLQDVGLRSESEAVFREALNLDPENDLAARALAASYERSRRVREATDLLEDLRRFRPEDAEACVRLGRMHTKAGRGSRAAAVWASCLDLQEPRWAVELAYQELARLLMAQGDWTAAEEVLRRGHERYPAQGRLALLLAYSLDRLQQPVEGRNVLANQPPSNTREESPRYRYSRWPRAAFAALRQQTDAAIDAYLPALARSVGPWEGESK